MALLGMFWGGVTPTAGSTDRATRFWARAARRTALGERAEVGVGVGVRLKRVVRVLRRLPGRGAIL